MGANQNGHFVGHPEPRTTASDPRALIVRCARSRQSQLGLSWVGPTDPARLDAITTVHEWNTERVVDLAGLKSETYRSSSDQLRKE
jgi:hypothetical protein